MTWYGVGPAPDVCSQHANAGQRQAAMELIERADWTTADPRHPFPDVTITPKALFCELSIGWVAKIHGLHPKYVYARTFQSRFGPPWGWKLTGNGLYECREIGPYARFSAFFVIKGVLRRRVELVAPEKALELARRMGATSS